MKEYSIGTSCIPCVGFKYGCHEDKDIPCVLASRSSILKIYMWYDQEEEMKMEFLCGTQY